MSPSVPRIANVSLSRIHPNSHDGFSLTRRLRPQQSTGFQPVVIEFEMEVRQAPFNHRRGETVGNLHHHFLLIHGNLHVTARLGFQQFRASFLDVDVAHWEVLQFGFRNCQRLHAGLQFGLVVPYRPRPARSAASTPSRDPLNKVVQFSPLFPLTEKLNNLRMSPYLLVIKFLTPFTDELADVKNQGLS
jgi:hypothetical protein